MTDALLNRLKDSKFIEKLIENNEVSGYLSPSGKITYNKIVDSKSFGVFSDTIMDCVPLKYVLNPEKAEMLPSFARVIPELYPKYLILNSTLADYTEEQDIEDSENMTELLDLIEPGKYIAGIAIQKSEFMGSAHAIAFIAWKISNLNKYKFAYYDSLAFRRGKNAFDYTDYAFVKERFEENIEFIDLNKYCFTPANQELEKPNFHCSQYVINSEYCYLFALYFLVKWLEFGGKLHRATFRKAIKATYIVEPSKLSRANNRESMIYRVFMMSFICRSLLAFLSGLTGNSRKFVKNIKKNVSRIRGYLREFKMTYGFDLLE
jgi:hypothetical protein